MSAIAEAPRITPKSEGGPPAEKPEKQGMSKGKKIGLGLFAAWFAGVIFFVILFGLKAHKAPAVASGAFSPTDEEVAMARKMIAAFELPENRDKGVVQVDGRMVERLHAEMAQRTVAIADAIAKTKQQERLSSV